MKKFLIVWTVITLVAGALAVVILMGANRRYRLDCIQKVKDTIKFHGGREKFYKEMIAKAEREKTQVEEEYKFIYEDDIANWKRLLSDNEKDRVAEKDKLAKIEAGKAAIELFAPLDKQVFWVGAFLFMFWTIPVVIFSIIRIAWKVG